MKNKINKDELKEGLASWILSLQNLGYTCSKISRLTDASAIQVRGWLNGHSLPKRSQFKLLLKYFPDMPEPLKEGLFIHSGGFSSKNTRLVGLEPTPLSEALFSKMKDRNISVDELANLLGVTSSSVQSYVFGSPLRNPRLLSLLVEIFGPDPVFENSPRFRQKIKRKQFPEDGFQPLETDSAFVSWFKEKCISMGVSQATLSKKTGLTPSSISRICSGSRKPSVTARKKISLFLGADFYEETPNPDFDSFGDWLSFSRKKEGVVLANLASILSVSLNDISDWSSNKSFPKKLRHLNSLEAILGKIPDHLRSTIEDQLPEIIAQKKLISEDYSDFKSWFRLQKESLGLSSSELARFLNDSEVRLNNWIKGGSLPSAKAILVIEQKLEPIPNSVLATMVDKRKTRFQNSN